MASHSTLGAHLQAGRLVGTELKGEAIGKIDDEMAINGILWQLVQKLIRQVFQGGISVKLRVGSELIELNENTQNFLDTHWLPTLKQAYEAALKYGVYPIVYVPFEKRSGETVIKPSVPIEGSWSIRFVVNEHGMLDYTLYRVGAQNNAIFAGGGAPTVWPNGRVFELMRPRIDGRINSIISRTLRFVKTMNNSWQHYSDVSAEQAEPPFVIQQVATNRSGARVDGPADIPFGETDAGFDEGERRQQLDDEDRRALQIAVEMSANSLAEKKTEGYDALRQQTFEKRVKQPWETRKFHLPAGTTLVSNFPRPQVPSAFMSVNNELISIIARILEIPDQIASQAGRGRFAANANLAQRQFNDLIESIQKQLVPHIEEMFYDIYSKDHRIFVENVAEVMQLENDRTFTDEELARIRDDVQVVVMFNHVPDITFEILEKMYRNDLIPLEEFARQVFRIFNICEGDSCLTKNGTFFSDKTRKDQERAAKSREREISAVDQRGSARGDVESKGGDVRQAPPPTTRGTSAGKATRRRQVQASAALVEQAKAVKEQNPEFKHGDDFVKLLQEYSETVEVAKGEQEQIAQKKIGGYTTQYLRAHDSESTKYYRMFNVGSVSDRHVTAEVTETPNFHEGIKAFQCNNENDEENSADTDSDQMEIADNARKRARFETSNDKETKRSKSSTINNEEEVGKKQEGKEQGEEEGEEEHDEEQDVEESERKEEGGEKEEGGVERQRDETQTHSSTPSLPSPLLPEQQQKLVVATE